MGEREHAHMRERLREREEGGDDGQEEEGVWELCEEKGVLSVARVPVFGTATPNPEKRALRPATSAPLLRSPGTT